MVNSIYNKFRRITTNQQYFPEIDGIRFLAIVLVMLFHIHGYFTVKSPIKLPNSNGYSLLETFFENGNRGVQLFFVLSGFILCLPFAQQYINNGKKVELKKYFLRRLTRLEPPYFIAMTAFLVMHIVMKTLPVNILIPSWLASLAYLHNIIYCRTPRLTVVAWSLEIEIQFYLCAPLLFRLLALNKIKRRTILCIICIVLMLLQEWYSLPFWSIYKFAQYFLIGILLADFYVSNTAAAFFNSKWIWVPAVFCLAAILFLPIDNFLLGNLCFPFLIGLFYYIVLKNDSIKKIFSYKFIPIIGGMCYSIYLLHYVIISMFGRFTINIHFTNYYLPNLLLQIGLLSIVILILSSIFYYYIERPFMSKKWLSMLMGKGKEKKEEQSNMNIENSREDSQQIRA